jgi:hypothetical protein
VRRGWGGEEKGGWRRGRVRKGEGVRKGGG